MWRVIPRDRIPGTLFSSETAKPRRQPGPIWRCALPLLAAHSGLTCDKDVELETEPLGPQIASP